MINAWGQSVIQLGHPCRVTSLLVLNFVHIQESKGEPTWML